MPKILRIINRFNLGGPTFNAALLSRYMPDEFETLLVGGQKEDHEDSSLFITDNLGLEPILIDEMQRSISFGKDRKAVAKIREIIREFQPDIVHTHASKAGAIGRYAAIKENVPHIVHTFHGHVFHSYFGPLKTAFYKATERWLARRSEAIIAISDIQKHELTEVHRICPPEKTHVIPLGFDLMRFTTLMDEKRIQFRKEIGADEKDVVISIVGRMVPIKDHALFIESVSRVKKSTDKKIKVVLVGDGELFSETVELARKKGWSVSTPDAIDKTAEMHFLSWRKDVDRIYAGSDVVALSSKNEGTPVSLIEAQAANKPIVTTDVGGVRDILHDEAFVVPPSDIEAFTDRLLSLVESQEIRDKMSSGQAFALENFHYRRLVDDMTELYKTLLGSESKE